MKQTRVDTLSPKRALGILGASLGLGLAFDFLFYGKQPGVSFAIYMNLVVGSLLIALHMFRASLPKIAALLIVPLLFFPWMVFVRAEGFVTFLNIIFSPFHCLVAKIVTRTVTFSS